MRKISIVQRRLETGLDLTQAELRALQREAELQPDQAEDSEATITAVENPLSFLPPTRPEETPEENWHQEADSEHPDADGTEARWQEGSGEGNEFASSRIPYEVGSAARAREGSLTGNAYEESSASDGEESLSASGEDLRAAVNEIFANNDFSFEVESADQIPENGEHELQNERNVLFPRQELVANEESPTEDNNSDSPEAPEARQAPGTTGSADKGESPAIAEYPVPKPVSREETLVLFLLQVPGNGLRARFSASQDANSPFAGQLRLASQGDGEAASPGEASQFDVNLPPQGLVRLSTGRVGNNGHEWALITLDEEAHAYATFDLQAGRNLRSTAAVFTKSPSRKSSIPVRTSPFEDHGLVVANPTERPVVVKLTLVDEKGNEVITGMSHEMDPLPPGKQVAIFAKSAFSKVPGINSFSGRMIAEVVGEGLIWTAGLNQNDGILSFLPVAEMDKFSERRA
jgi:hypothetical protein